MKSIRSESTDVDKPIVLSIQSHVVTGYVGNRAAVFPLQRLGCHVDVINTVQFASLFVHEGQKLSDADMQKLLWGLIKVNDCSELAKGIDLSSAVKATRWPYSHIITGYMGNALFLKETVKFIQYMKQHTDILSNKRQLLWLCDPVLGDNGKFYVDEELLGIYKHEAIPLADIVTPNQFELQCLTDCVQINTLYDVLCCLDKLHAQGPSMVIVTSVSFSNVYYNNDDTNSMLYFIGSQTLNEPNESDNKENKKQVIEEYIGRGVIDTEQLDILKNKKLVIIKFRKIEKLLGGTGDLLAALLLYNLHYSDILTACELTISSVQSIIAETLQRRSHECNCVDVISTQKYFSDPLFIFQGIIV